jgi:mRNA interferase HigB
MRVVARSALKKFYSRPDCRDAEEPFETWYHEVKRAKWISWTDIKAKYASASILKKNRVVFNIGGNKYRLVVKINYPAQVVYIRFVGTHEEYDTINAEEI